VTWPWSPSGSAYCRRAAARDTLDAAIRLFETGGAQPWIGLAELELRRLDGTHTGESASGALTGAETRLAELVAGGVSNAEAAATLCVSVKTVESMLTRVYRKLGLRSRAQLAARLKN
jgi:DNA-binding NarL/FixJ family response regulator